MSRRSARRGASDGAAPRRRPPFLLAAAAVVAVALVLLPLVYLVVRAFEGGAGAWDILLRPATHEVLWKTALLVASVTAAAVGLGVPLAWLVARTDLLGRRVWAVLAALPLVVPSYVAALAFIAAFGPRGLLQKLLEGPFGVERVPEIYGFTGAFLSLSLTTYPYVFVLCLATFRTLDPSLEEAARGLGRSRLASFRTVTLPLLRPTIGAGALLVALYTLSDFGAVSLMQYDSLTRAVFLQYRALFDRAPAAVLGLVLVAIAAVVLVLEERSRGRARYHRQTPGAVRPAERVALGRWRWPAVGFCTAVIAMALAVPLAVLGYWFARAVELGKPLEAAWGAALSSVLVSGATAAAAVLVALPVAVLAVRYPCGRTRALERLSYAANALPGIVIALALVFFGARYASPVYQTLFLLLAAYVIRFFPQAVAGAHSAFVRVNPRLEDAARGLGRPPLAVFRRITLPLIAPGLLAGATLVFLSTMKELPATLLLRPIGFETLATEVWTKTAVAAYSEAAAPALLLVALAAPFAYLLVARGVTEPDAHG